VALRPLAVPFTSRRTQAGAAPVVSLKFTVKVNVVVVVPVPGETEPPAIVTVPQVRARTGAARANRDAISNPVRANAATSLVVRPWRRADRRVAVPFGIDHMTCPAGRQ
jgi:hypothetical protein